MGINNYFSYYPPRLTIFNYAYGQAYDSQQYKFFLRDCV